MLDARFFLYNNVGLKRSVPSLFVTRRDIAHLPLPCFATKLFELFGAYQNPVRCSSKIEGRNLVVRSRL